MYRRRLTAGSLSTSFAFARSLSAFVVVVGVGCSSGPEPSAAGEQEADMRQGTGLTDPALLAPFLGGYVRSPETPATDCAIDTVSLSIEADESLLLIARSGTFNFEHSRFHKIRGGTVETQDQDDGRPYTVVHRSMFVPIPGGGFRAQHWAKKRFDPSSLRYEIDITANRIEFERSGHCVFDRTP